jgi:hypothetical protein
VGIVRKDGSVNCGDATLEECVANAEVMWGESYVRECARGQRQQRSDRPDDDESTERAEGAMEGTEQIDLLVFLSARLRVLGSR